MFSNSLLVKDKSTKEQWFYPFLKDKENCLMFDPNNLESLLENLEWAAANESEVLNMIENANKLANDYLTPKAIEEYTVAAINKYTDLVGAKHFNHTYGNVTSHKLLANLQAAPKKIREEFDFLKPSNIFKVFD
jgi:hypothetical protein